MKALIRLMRPHHYLKNVLVFVPLLFSGKLLQPERLLKSFLAFVAFCLMSSFIYVLNDIKDVESDRAHSSKKNRPIASGAVSIGMAYAFAVLLLLLAVLCLLVLNGGTGIWLIAALHVALNLIYSVLGGKHVAILDVLILASGFLWRVLFGALAVDVVVSNWLYLTVITASFYLAFGKRRNEMRTENGDTRPVLKSYSYEFLDKSMTMCLTLAIAFYALWSIDADTVLHHVNPHAIWTVPLVMAMVFRYSMDVEKTSSGDPMEMIAKDKILWVLGAVYAALMYWIIYGV